MKIIAFVLVLFSGVFISSCCYKEACSGIESVSVKFSGFNVAELDTIYRTAYAVGSGFANVTLPERRDTIWETDDSAGLYRLVTDIYIDGQLSVEITGDYDWKIFIPAVNKTIYLTNFGYRVYTCSNGCLLRKGDQVKSITSCTVDGVVMPSDGVVIRK